MEDCQLWTKDEKFLLDDDFRFRIPPLATLIYKIFLTAYVLAFCLWNFCTLRNRDIPWAARLTHWTYSVVTLHFVTSCSVCVVYHIYNSLHFHGSYTRERLCSRPDRKFYEWLLRDANNVIEIQMRVDSPEQVTCVSLTRRDQSLSDINVTDAEFPSSETQSPSMTTVSKDPAKKCTHDDSGDTRDRDSHTVEGANMLPPIPVQTYVLQIATESDQTTRDINPEEQRATVTPADTTSLRWGHATFHRWVVATACILQTIAFVISLIVTLLYFSVLYPRMYPDGGISYRNLHTHGIASLLMAVDHLVSLYPVRLLHFIYPLSYILVYGLFSFVYWAASERRLPMYDQILDWNIPHKTFLYALPIIFIVSFVHFLVYLSYKLKIFLARKLI